MTPFPQKLKHFKPQPQRVLTREQSDFFKELRKDRKRAT